MEEPKKTLDLNRSVKLKTDTRNVEEAAVKSKREVMRTQAVTRVTSCPPDILGWAVVGRSLLNLLTLSSGFL